MIDREEARELPIPEDVQLNLLMSFFGFRHVQSGDTVEATDYEYFDGKLMTPPREESIGQTMSHWWNCFWRRYEGYDAGRSAREWRRVDTYDDLPTEEGTYWVTSREKLVYRCEFCFHDRNYWLEYIVAWQPVTPPEPYTEEERA